MPNKQLLKIAYIVGIISGVIEIGTIFLMLFGIITIIISFYIKKVYEMNNNDIEKNKQKLFYISIIYSLVSPISGIIALLFYIDLERKNEKRLKKEHTNK